MTTLTKLIAVGGMIGFLVTLVFVALFYAGLIGGFRDYGFPRIALSFIGTGVGFFGFEVCRLFSSEPTMPMVATASLVINTLLAGGIGSIVGILRSTRKEAG